MNWTQDPQHKNAARKKSKIKKYKTEQNKKKNIYISGIYLLDVLN